MFNTEKHFCYNHLDRKKEWYFLIVNKENQINEVENDLIKLFNPENLIKSFSGKIKDSELKYKALFFKSQKEIDSWGLKEKYPEIIRDTNFFGYKKDFEGIKKDLFEELEMGISK